YRLGAPARADAVHVARASIDTALAADSGGRAPGGAVYAASLRVARKALRWCIAHRPASMALPRRVHRRSMLAAARYHWHRRAITQMVRDLAMVARVR